MQRRTSAVDQDFFDGNSVTNGPLTTLADGTEGGTGVYRYTTSPALPSSGYNAENYWVDVRFVPTGASPTATATRTPPRPARRRAPLRPPIRRWTPLPRPLLPRPRRPRPRLRTPWRPTSPGAAAPAAGATVDAGDGLHSRHGSTAPTDAASHTVGCDQVAVAATGGLNY